MLLMSLTIPLGLPQRSVPKIHLTGGQCEYFLCLSKNIQLNSGVNRKIFPAAAIRRQSNTSASRKAFKQQRAALEREEAA